MNSSKTSVIHSITALAEPIVAAKSAFIIDCVLRRERSSTVVELFIDSDTGVTTDLCADVSRELSMALDMNNVIDKSYHLVVSSPGIDKPLKFPRQYPKHIGRKVKVKHMLHGITEITEGELMFADDKTIELKENHNKIVNIPFTQILETHVKPQW